MNYKYILLIILVYLLKVIIFTPQILEFEFSQNQVSDYLRSQDIEDPAGKIKDRIFISDSEIYLASGYLYATGESPAKYNFQHPPLAKYLYGYSIILFNNPYIVQLLFGSLFLVFTYLVAAEYFSQKAGLLTVGLLLIDPVMNELTQSILLDLPLALLLMIYIYFKKKFPSKILYQGVVLGLMAATKFASTAVIIFGLIVFSEYLKNKKLSIKDIIAELFSAGFVYLIVYIGFFLQGNNFVDFGMLQVKMVGFMLGHNTSQYFGNTVMMFLTGYYKDWWNGELLRSGLWSILWPVSLVVLIVSVLRECKHVRSLIVLLPIVLLTSTIRQFAFTRYFITIIPFMYMLLAYQIFQLIKKYEKRNS